MIGKKRRTNLINLHNTRQTYDYDCGAKALQTVMAYYGVFVREDKLIQALGSGKDGTRVQRMAEIAQENGFQVTIRENMSTDELRDYLRRGVPVIVLLQAWAERVLTLKEWKEDYDDGHYAIAIGYLRKVFLFEDPSSFRRTWLREREFLARWHDVDTDSEHKYEHFGMILSGREPSRQMLEHMD
jgi:predicted double-glycine peptidase